MKRAVVDAGCANRGQRAKVWHDNEKFLLCPDVYRKAGLEQIRFPPNSGDFKSNRDCVGPTPERLGGAGTGGYEAGKSPHGRSIQAPRSLNSLGLLHFEARRKQELLPEAGTRHVDEAAKVSLELLRTLRKIVCQHTRYLINQCREWPANFLSPPVSSRTRKKVCRAGRGPGQRHFLKIFGRIA